VSSILELLNGAWGSKMLDTLRFVGLRISSLGFRYEGVSSILELLDESWGCTMLEKLRYSGCVKGSWFRI